MASINFNPFGNWFTKPRNSISPINLLAFPESHSLGTSHSPIFAAVGISKHFSRRKPEEPVTKTDTEPGYYRKMAEQLFWESENLPDHRHTPEVEKILNEDPIFEKKENPTEEEIKENEKFVETFMKSPVVEFLARVEEIKDKFNQDELDDNEVPYHPGDRKLWKALPHVIGLDGRPMPRKAIKTEKESDDKFWDFAKQFFFGLWGFRQRPYPPGRPIDVAQAIGYERLEKRYYDFIMRSGGWYYKDRLGRTRGPCELITLKTAWSGGIIDKNTFIWGEDMDEFAPINMVYGMERAIATWEVRLSSAATAFLHNLRKGRPPWVPLKGHEKKSYKQLQEEAVESKRRDMAVLEANNGVWPGVRIPSHALFLWASGSELTTILEEDHMPNKYIPKHLRQQLVGLIPGLRPWEVVSIEQAMDKITYGGMWYREPLGSYNTGPPYIKNWNKYIMQIAKIYVKAVDRAARKLRGRIPGLDEAIERLDAIDEARQRERTEAAKRATKGWW